LLKEVVRGGNYFVRSMRGKITLEKRGGVVYARIKTLSVGVFHLWIAKTTSME